MPDHKAIPDAELHEPKGAAGASSGDIYTANGAGSGVWTPPAIHEPKGIDTATTMEMYVADGLGGGSWQDNAMSVHGQMAVTNNSTATVTASAADATLNTDSDYVKIVAGWSGTHLEGITFNTDKLVVPVDGDYTLSFWCAVKVPLNNNFVGVKFAVDDATPYSLQKLVTQSVTTTDYKNMFGSSMLTLTAGQTISIYIASS